MDCWSDLAAQRRLRSEWDGVRHARAEGMQAARDALALEALELLDNAETLVDTFDWRRSADGDEDADTSGSRATRVGKRRQDGTFRTTDLRAAILTTRAEACEVPDFDRTHQPLGPMWPSCSPALGPM